MCSANQIVGRKNSYNKNNFAKVTCNMTTSFSVGSRLNFDYFKTANYFKV